MMPPLRSFDDLDGKERGQKKTDDLRTMATLGPRTLLKLQNKTWNEDSCLGTIFISDTVPKIRGFKTPMVYE